MGSRAARELRTGCGQWRLAVIATRSHHPLRHLGNPLLLHVVAMLSILCARPTDRRPVKEGHGRNLDWRCIGQVVTAQHVHVQNLPTQHPGGGGDTPSIPRTDGEVARMCGGFKHFDVEHLDAKKTQPSGLRSTSPSVRARPGLALSPTPYHLTNGL